MTAPLEDPIFIQLDRIKAEEARLNAEWDALHEELPAIRRELGNILLETSHG